MTATSVLVVEDEQIISLDLQQSLEEMGYAVVGAADNGQEAISIADSQRPDVVLMDIMLKGDMDGIDAGKQVGKLGIPVIYLTAYSDTETVKRATATAPYGFLTKPYQRRELAATIEVVLYKIRMERKLRESEQWFSATLRCVNDAVVATDTEGRITFLNPTAENMTGLTHSDAAGRRLEEVLKFSSGNTTPGTALHWRVLKENTAVGVEQDQRLVSLYGRETVVDYSAAPIRGDNNQVLGCVIVLRDVSERQRYEQRLRASETYFRHIFEYSPVGMALITKEGYCHSVNSAFARMLGYTIPELLGVEQSLISHQDDLRWEQDYLEDLTSQRNNTVQFEKRYLHRDGDRVLWTLVNAILLQETGQPECFLYQVHDLTERKQSEARLQHLAHMDPLTCLSNRTHLEQEMMRMFSYARRYQEHLVIAYLDLDHFKQINDSLGHDAGDELLRTVARRLKAAVRESDCVARMGGDEFVLVLHQIKDAEHAAQVLDKLRAQISEPIFLDGKNCVVTASIGVSLFPVNGEDAKLLLHQADRALLVSKAAGRNRITFSTPDE